MANREEIGQRIRHAREGLGLSQSELGRKMSRSRTHAAISDLERGVVRIDVEELSELAKLLDKELAYFYGDYKPDSSHDVVYRRGDRHFSTEDQQETDRAVDSFKALVRERHRKSQDSSR